MDDDNFKLYISSILLIFLAFVVFISSIMIRAFQ